MNINYSYEEDFRGSISHKLALAKVILCSPKGSYMSLLRRDLNTDYEHLHQVFN